MPSTLGMSTVSAATPVPRSASSSGVVLGSVGTGLSSLTRAQSLGKQQGSPRASISFGRSSGVSPGSGGGGGNVKAGGVGGPTMRRNSLGDLKIPERINQVQAGLRRDLGMVWEFAANVERGCHLF